MFIPLFLNRLHDNALGGLVGKAGRDGDAVVRRGLQAAPIRVGNGADIADLVGAGPVDGGIGDGISRPQILDAADGVLRAAVVAAQSNVAIPTGGGAVVRDALCHAAGVLPANLQRIC